MSTSVKWISSDMRGAPQISGTAGTMIAALDALFTTGWGITTAISVNVSGGIATATLQSGETFLPHSVVLIAGATPGALNGEARVLTSSSTSITWATAAADGAATGTVTIKHAPQTSWSKVYAGTNKAVYRSTHVQSNGHYLRVDDAGTTACRVRGFESMTDVDTGLGPFPTDAQSSGGGYWWRSAAANASSSKYKMFCDERFIIVSIAHFSSQTPTYLSAPARGFGDLIPLSPSGDMWCTSMNSGSSSSTLADNCSYISSLASLGLSTNPRAVSGIGSAVDCYFRPFTGTIGGGYSGADSLMGAFPSTIDGQLKLSRMFSRQASTSEAPRAIVPGVLYIPQSGVYGQISDGDLLDGDGELVGRKLVAVANCGSGSPYAAPNGIYVVDITGPWR